MGDQEAKGDEYEKKAEKKLKGWGILGSKYDDAAELFEKAGNCYKLAKSWDKAANSYIQLANCHIKLESKHEAASAFVDAAVCYKKFDSKEAIKYMNLAVQMYMEIGRLSMAAKYFKELSELVAAIKAPHTPSSITAVQPLVRNSPNFTKYDGKIDHGAVNQFIHQFVAHFQGAKIKDPQDKVHLAAPHLTGEAITWWQHWADKHTDPLTHTTKFQWDIFVSDFKQRFLSPEYLTALEDEFAGLKQKGMPVLSYSNKLLTLTQQIGSTEKEKLRAFSRGLDASIKYGVRNLKPATYEEALALAQNKELELNNGKPKQPTSSTSSLQTNGKSQANKTAKPNTPSKPKMTPDEKAKAGVIGGYLTPEEQNAYMAEQ
ncbi:hypothetical protein L7F22_021788 [Adiantum nelumboides]|nr:hypothetical protein [Adiantum nelumboides]